MRTDSLIAMVVIIIAAFALLFVGQTLVKKAGKVIVRPC